VPSTGFAALASLTALTHLNVAETAFADLGVLSKLTRLESLGLWKTRVTSLAPLVGMKHPRNVYACKLDVPRALAKRRPPIAVDITICDGFDSFMPSMLGPQPGRM
jgi:hypothetical protein